MIGELASHPSACLTLDGCPDLHRRGRVLPPSGGFILQPFHLYMPLTQPAGSSVLAQIKASPHH